jgi:hypothetical protein
MWDSDHAPANGFSSALGPYTEDWNIKQAQVHNVASLQNGSIATPNYSTPYTML